MVHMVDEGTHYTTAALLRNQSTAEIWETICRISSLTCVFPPNSLVVDQVSSYVSAEFKTKLESDGVQLRQAPIETRGLLVSSNDTMRHCGGCMNSYGWIWTGR